MPHNYSAYACIHIWKTQIGGTLVDHSWDRLKSECQLTGLEGTAAATDALLLLFPMRFTKHGLWRHTEWTAEAALRVRLLHFLRAMVYRYLIPDTIHCSTLRRSSNRTEVQEQVQLLHRIWKYRVAYFRGETTHILMAMGHCVSLYWRTLSPMLLQCTAFSKPICQATGCLLSWWTGLIGRLWTQECNEQSGSQEKVKLRSALSC